MAEDVLDVVRECVQNQRQIKEINGKISLGGRCFPKNVETTFPCRWQKGNSKGRKFYNLGEICFFVRHRLLPHVEYVKKAKEKEIRHVQKPERKLLMNRVCPNPKRKLRSGLERATQQTSSVAARIYTNEESICQSSDDVGTESKNLQGDENTGGSAKQNLRTYSRKRSNHEFKPTARPQSEDQFSFVDASAAYEDDLSDELMLLKSENLQLERTLKSMESFLQDHLGVTSEQLKSIQECESNTVELSLIASHVKNNIVHADMFTNGDAASRTSYGNSKSCYKAVKHPIRGWEMTKQDLSSVLLGYEDLKQSGLEKPLSSSVEQCLSKGMALLKRTFSVLISQMREHNSPSKPQEESDLFFKKIVKDCISDAVDSFRDMFTGLLNTGNSTDSANVERWVDISRAELGKIFHSLALTLQSLRDIHPAQQKAPTSLFHFPEPTFSLALNPAKVTHSVVLEMYVHIGLAELRRIIWNIVEQEKEDHSMSFTPLSSNGGDNHVNEGANFPPISQGSTLLQSIKIEESLHNISPSITENQAIDNMCDAYQDTQNSLNKNLGHQCTASSSRDYLSAVLLKKKRSLKGQSNSLNHRFSERNFDQCQASIKNDIISSLKEKIQEKIQAGTAGAFQPNLIDSNNY